MNLNLTFINGNCRQGWVKGLAVKHNTQKMLKMGPVKKQEIILYTQSAIIKLSINSLKSL